MTVTIKVSAADLARAYLPAGRKTGSVNVADLGITSQKRRVRWIMLGKNGIIVLSGLTPSPQRPRWEQKYRGHAPIDD